MKISLLVRLCLTCLLLCGSGGVARAAASTSYRMVFPEQPLPVGQTNDWARSNLTSVVISAGGSGAWSNQPNSQPVFPATVPPHPDPDYTPDYLLVQSTFGQTVSGDRPDIYLGQPIDPPLNELPAGWSIYWAGMTNVQIDPSGHAFYEPSVRQLYAIAGGAMTVNWVITDGQSVSNVSHTYLVSSAPATRPYRVYWTEEPYNAPTIDLSDRFVRFLWNEEIPAPVIVETNINNVTQNVVVRGLWVDHGQLHVQPGAPGTSQLQGLVVMQYFKTGALKEQVPGGVIVVQVSEPQVSILDAEIGSRLLPRDGPFGHQGLTPMIKHGLEDPATVYQHKGQYSHSPKNEWVFPIRRTDESPWEIEIYWEEADYMGTLWPYEVDWYSADWTSRPQVFVRGDPENLGASVFIPSDLGPAMPFQEPPGHANLSQDGVFLTTEEGYTLLRFQSQDNVWFQTVRSVSHTNPYFDREPRPWTIGVEIGPNVSSDALLFNGVSDSVTVSNLPSLGTHFTLETWFLLDHPDDGYLKPLLARPGPQGFAVPETMPFLLAVNGEGRLIAEMGKGNTEGGTPYGVSLASLPVQAGQWYHAAFTVETSGEATLYLDAQGIATATFTGGAIQTDAGPLYIGWAGPDALFRGQLDDIRLWTTCRSAHEIVIGQVNFLHDYATVDGLLAYFPVESDVESGFADLRNNYEATLVGCQHVEPGATGLLERYGFSEYHGYIYDPTGLAPYNPGRYAYPTTQDPLAETYIFGVNSGLMEIWWSHKVQQAGMPVPVYFPAWAQVYTNVWPANAPEIVLASGQGSPAFLSASIPTIYMQNDPEMPGYNPNEEHALIGQAHNGYAAFALRDDLNAAGESEPFVLVDCNDPLSQQPAMKVYKVVRTSDEYPSFTYGAEAGDALLGPHPLDFLPYVDPTTSPSPQAWRDRKRVWYAVGAGATDTETANIEMKNYYPMQEGFWFPRLTAEQQPPFGTPLPWLPAEDIDFTQPDYWADGTPVDVTWVVAWPTNVPLMRVGQTLTKAVGGLPEIWGQLSVDVVYQQSAHLQQSHRSVALIDPTIERTVTLTRSIADYGFITGSAGSIYNRHGLIYFNGLPPDLSGRLYYDPNRATDNLRFLGQLVEPRTSSPFLLINRLTEAQRSEIKALCAPTAVSPTLKAEWDQAIDGLAINVVEVVRNQPFDHLALAAVGTGAGYVTLAFNDADNPDMGISPGDPITVQCIKVIPELYAGFLIPMTDDLNLLSDQMNMLYSESLGGEADKFEFQWRAQSPTITGGVPDDPDAASLFAQEEGLTRLRIGGQGATLLDMVNRFFTVRYRATNEAVVAVVGTKWSEYTAFNLAEGWVERVLNELTPFEQRMRDLYNNPAETQASMIAQAGTPYVGDVALNMESVSSAGLIEVYQTVLNRARHLSLDLNINDPGVNQQLMLAVSRLHALYMLLGNEAYADALDPTIGFGSSTVINNGAVLPVDYGSFASSLFCFDNQVPTLLDEELALLRGRGNPALAPGMNQWPYYNRLVWNFTKGIDAGEVAYAVNYNIRDSASVLIDEETAAELYPQGHGDAWGYYLSALKGYYSLLRNPNFNWGDPSITPLLLGYQVVSADYKDEERFAEAAAALARTGTEIVRRAYRKGYTESPSLSLTALGDTDTNRCWSASEWAGRAGQAAFYNWAVCQSLLPAASTNAAIEADIRRIDRATVKAVNVIPANYIALQREADHLDQGLNPLGLASGAVPFDISPAQVDAGQTHFEQIFERATVALRNAQAAFDNAQQAARLLRQQSSGQVEFQLTVQDQETAYKNQLIQLLGYPYADDIGAGKTYEQGYDGPDLYHYPYMDLESLGFDKSTDIGEISVTEFTFTPEDLEEGGEHGELSHVRTNLTFHFAENGFLAKPDDWTSRRRAEGEIQHAYGEYLTALLEFRAAGRRYDDRYSELDEEYDFYHQQWYDLNQDRVDINIAATGAGIALAWSEALAKSYTLALHENAEFATDMKNAILDGLPRVLGLANDTTFTVRGTMQWLGYTITQTLKNMGLVKETWLLGLKASTKTTELNAELKLAKNEAKVADEERRLAILGLDRELDIASAELLAALQRVENAQEKFLSVQAEAERVLVDREWSRSQATARIASMRYNDMAFRIFRNDALRRYGDAFELAARYTYLAAKAYDYETGLLKSETQYDPGTVFFNDIIRARTIGRVVNGQPALAATGIGEPGLSDILARMNANWSVLKGRFGFNNPQSETGRFSLRTELFRILPGANGDETWRQKLEQCKVDNLLNDEIFRRYCLPFVSQQALQAREPALVIPFHSTIDFARNFFDWELAGGDNAYDSTHFATKIRSVGVWFSNYDALTSTADNLFLANQPRVYLVPAGLDVMRSPSDLGESLRGWKVLDQAIPVPFPITPEEMTQPDFIPIYDSLTEPWAKARRYPGLRAYHDNGFTTAEMTYNSRLVGRSVWNTQWVLIIPAGTLNSMRDAALDRFIYGPTGTNGVSDIKLHFQTYSCSGN